MGRKKPEVSAMIASFSAVFLRSGRIAPSEQTADVAGDREAGIVGAFAPVRTILIHRALTLLARLRARVGHEAYNVVC